jgi:Formate/nitrite family of transporters
MSHIKNIVSAVLAGICIGIGGTVFLSVENSVIASVLFSIGLISITIFKLNLFTGKLCFITDNKPTYIIELVETWIGNFIGTTLVALAIRFTRLDLYPIEFVEGKLNDNLLSTFILAVFCGILMYIAVAGYKKTDNYIMLILPVAVFLLCRFEHCVGNMFFFSLCGVWDVKAVITLLVMTLGNLTGGLIFQIADKKLHL